LLLYPYTQVYFFTLERPLYTRSPPIPLQQRKQSDCSNECDTVTFNAMPCRNNGMRVRFTGD
ncbi:MAG: hypothetical protein AAGJ35_08790, partial [Myxococcota bacterium]